jgi:hypothetical protein
MVRRDNMHTKGKVTYDISFDMENNPVLHVCDETGTCIAHYPINEEAVKYIEHGREMVKHLKRARMRLESAWHGLHDPEDREACTLSIEDIKDLLAKLEKE